MAPKNECLAHLSDSVTMNCNIKHPIRYSLDQIIAKLIEASEILLIKKGYDGDGWELLYYATEAAKLIEIEPLSIITVDSKKED